MERKLIVLGILLLISVSIFAQKVDENWLAEKFGPRFISAREAGFDQNLPIPFTEAELKYDRSSWIMPVNVNGIIKYCLIRALFVPNSYEKYDTLSLIGAEEVFHITSNTGRAFPNAERVRFFMTKDWVVSDNGLKYYYTLNCNGLNYSVIQLLANTKLASSDNSVMLLNEKDIIVGVGGGNAEIGKVMTLVRLIKSD